MQGVPGVPAIQGELNPAAWMLEITTPGMEHQLAVDFAQVYKESDLARCAADSGFEIFSHFDSRTSILFCQLGAILPHLDAACSPFLTFARLLVAVIFCCLQPKQTIQQAASRPQAFI